MPRAHNRNYPDYHRVHMIHATQMEFLADTVSLHPAPDIKLFCIVHFADGSSGTVTGVIHRPTGWMYEIDCGRTWAYSHHFFKSEEPELGRRRKKRAERP